MHHLFLKRGLVLPVFLHHPRTEDMKGLYNRENLNAEDVVLLWAAYQCSLQEL